MKSSLRALALTSLLLVAGCDSAGEPEITGSLAVFSGFPDGTPVSAEVTVTQLDPRQPSGFPVIHQARAMAPEGRHTFEGLPPGPYVVNLARYSFGEWGPEVVPPEGWSAVVAGETTRHEAFFGYRWIPSDHWAAYASLPSEDQPYAGAESRGLGMAVRFDLDAIRVGQHHDVVRRLSMDVSFSESSAREVVLRVYRIPEAAAWGTDDPGPLSYEYLREGPSPLAEVTVSYWEGTGYLTLPLDPAAFFTATNGIAVLVEGEEVGGLDAFQNLRVEYVWEWTGERPGGAEG